MDNENFKLTMHCYDKTITVERDNPEVTIHEAVEDVVTGLLGLTFYKSQIIEAFKEYIEAEENEIC